MARRKFTEEDIRASGKHDPVVFHDKFRGYEIMSRKEVQERVVAGVAFYTRGRLKAGSLVLEIYKWKSGVTYRWSSHSGQISSLPGCPRGYTMMGSLPGYPRAVQSRDNGWNERLENERRKKEKVEADEPSPT